MPQSIYTSIHETTMEILQVPMVEWERRIMEVSPSARYDILRHLDGVIEQAARLRGYVDMRYGSGCGDQGHADGVKESNRLAFKIRKALGFTLVKKEVRF